MIGLKSWKALRNRSVLFHVDHRKEWDKLTLPPKIMNGHWRILKGVAQDPIARNEIADRLSFNFGSINPHLAVFSISSKSFYCFI